MGKKSQIAPNVVALLSQLATLRTQKGWTSGQVREFINEHLVQKIPDSRSSNGQVNRWMHPYSKGFVEPRGEVVIAIQRVLQHHSR